MSEPPTGRPALPEAPATTPSTEPAGDPPGAGVEKLRRVLREQTRRLAKANAACRAAEAAERRAREGADRMQRLTAALTRALTREEVGEAVMREGITAVAAYAGVIAVRGATGPVLEILASTGSEGGGPARGERRPLGAPSPLAEATRSGEAVFVESPESWERRYPGESAPRGDRSAAWAAVPLRLDDATPAFGALLWMYEQPRAFDADERALLGALARQAAQALERGRLHDAERQARLTAERAVERVARLQRVTAALSEALTRDEVAGVVVEQGVAALGAHAGSIALLAEGGARLDVVRAVGYPPEVLERYSRFALDDPFPLAEAARGGVPIFLRTAEERAARYPELAALRSSNGRGAMAAVPLVVDGRVLGALGLNFSEEVVLHAEDRIFIVTLAQQGAQALERARLFDAERWARAEAETANRAKSEFLSAMSHELRTPLNAIGGYAELMEMELRGPVTDAQRADLQRIRRNQHHLLTLINDVLNFARLEAGRLELNPRPVEMARILADLEHLVLPQLASRALRYAWRVDGSPLLALADPDRLQQVLINLVSNAIKFTPPGGEIDVEATPTSDGVAVRVRDTGPGVPEDRLEQIFEPFVQLGRGLTSSHEGAGLGLAIARDLARAMGGDLRAGNAPGAGATFTLTLAAVPDPAI